jgi:regulator of RNase E activity RraA
MDPEIRPLSKGRKMIGRAHTVLCRGDFLSVIKALEDSKEGEVLVIAAGGEKTAVAGEMFTTEAKRKGLAGIVIDGGYRDTTGLDEIDLPVYSRHITPMAGSVSKISETQVPVDCGGVRVEPGDIVIGDDDGIVIVAEHELSGTIEAAEEIRKREEQIISEMKRGRSLFEYLNFAEHYDKTGRNEPSQLKFKV